MKAAYPAMTGRPISE